MKNENINILVSVNSKFIVPLKVLLFSLYKTQSHKCSIYFMNGSLVDREIEDLNSLCNLLNFEFHLIEVPNETINFLKKNKEEELSHHGLSIETYFRIFAPEILSNIDKILWLDADCIIKKDIWDFYSQDLEDITIAACDQGNWTLQDSSDFYIYSLFNRNEKGLYFNSGVILFNLKQCRQIENFKFNNILKIIEFTHFKHFDQDILNYIINPIYVKWENPLLYNMFINQYWTCGFKNHPIQYKFYDNAFILHYCSIDKPWNLLNSMGFNVRKYWLDTYKELQLFLK